MHVHNYALWLGYACNRIVLKETKKKTINTQTEKKKRKKAVTTQKHNANKFANNEKHKKLFGKMIWAAANEMQYPTMEKVNQ